MERHDIELKQREDNVITLKSEEAYCNRFDLNLIFEYKGIEYGATTTYYEGTTFFKDNIEMWDVNTGDIPEHIYDELYDWVKDHFAEMKIDSSTITWE